MAALPFRDINVHASTSHYAFSSPSTPSAQTLVVERPSGDLRLTNDKILGSRRVSAVAGIFGMISLRLDKYIIVINKANPVGRIKGNMIYKVVTTEFLPLRERALHDADEDRYISLLKDLIKSSPLYFSYGFDITSCFQRQSQSDLSNPLWQRADERFFWNRFIQSDFIDLRNGKGGRLAQGREQPGVDSFILPVMFGMLEIRNTSIKGTPLTYILITRRSRFRSGTRYFSRGLDDEGHVSNFNETEQAVILNDEASKGPVSYAGDQGMQYEKLKAAVGQEAQILSYVQTRGSVPVFWAEVNNLHYTPKVQIRGVDSAVTAAGLHFQEQIDLYGDNYLVNLVNQKGREQRVKESYEQVVEKLVSSPTQQRSPNDNTSEKFNVIESKSGGSQFDRLHYVYFDFHNETKGLQWHRAKLLLQKLEQPIIHGGYFRAVDMPGGASGLEVRSKQNAVVRTNCMDCLDRTNVVQSMLGRFVLSRMLIDLGVLQEGGMVEDDQSFEHLFRNIWADNADVVSKAYSGTGALKTDFTRTGERTKKGAFQDFTNSTTRYVKNNFLDGPRQDAFDVFHGVYKPGNNHLGKSSIFADTRPLAIQSVPYVLAACIFLVFIGSFTRREATSAVWPLRLMMIISLVAATICLHFMVKHGMLYVNWPKLNTPPWAIEGFQDALTQAKKNPVMASLVKGHERGRSEARVGYMEEGKTRIE
ncbi:phosphoinositide phosphatase-like protein [Microthyrium microscopicum]|uniref:Phosphoinositide phosphatase-like protein n=1 Tax=Microthyrium microscopicum TaxID=703497 RepID=A0A6A6U048_9PEZI|nr:phosphoinositide phosphatase-like protein [Microthyrium microscopicum]